MAYDLRASNQALPTSIFWLLATWVVLLLVALVWGIDNAESTLRADASDSLTANGYRVSVDFSGRDARLIGTVTSAQLAEDVAQSIDSLPGVRHVHNELVVVDPEPPPMQSPEVEVQLIGGVVSLAGMVPSDDAANDLENAAQTQFGADRVVNALVVSENVESRPWLGRIRDVFPQLGELRSGGFEATEERLFIAGEVISEEARSGLVDGLEMVLGDLLPVVAELTIAVLPPPTFSASGTSDAVILEGVLPNQEAVERINAAAERFHANAQISNQLSVGDVAAPAWLDSIEGILDVVGRLDPWTIVVGEGIVAVTGLADDQEVVGAVDLLLEEVIKGELSVSTDIAVDPNAIADQLTDLLEGSATFETNSVELSAAGTELLDMAIDILGANPTTVLTVEGHTDNRGSAAANLELSQQRAEAVVAYLVGGGIDAGRLSAVGYGEERPIADNATAEGRAQNRRIEFAIREGDG